jgi:hypothetical protein
MKQFFVMAFVPLNLLVLVGRHCTDSTTDVMSEGEFRLFPKPLGRVADVFSTHRQFQPGVINQLKVVFA